MGLELNIEIYNRLFALFMKTRNTNLALSYLVHLEEQREGEISFSGLRAQGSELLTSVNDWSRALVLDGPAAFHSTLLTSARQYQQGIPDGSSAGGIGGSVLDLDLQQQLLYLLQLSSDPTPFTVRIYILAAL
jgi:hypothetical protein